MLVSLRGQKVKYYETKLILNCYPLLRLQILDNLHFSAFFLCPSVIRLRCMKHATVEKFVLTH